MIVPANRMLFWTAVTALPFAALGAAVPSAAAFSAAVIGAFLAMAALDAVFAGKTVLSISVEFPETVRLARDREGEVGFLVRSGSARAHQLRIGLAFPRQIATPHEDLSAALPPKGEALHFRWPCTPLKRGRYVLDACHLEGISPLGLWAGRLTVPIRCEVRVYPNLLAERKNLAALFLDRGNFGLHAQRQVGEGREFEKLREYVHGDGFDHIHWKTTAKRGRPVTKVFQIERTQEVYVIIDASRLSGRTSHTAGPGEPREYPETVLERFITAGLIMGTAAERQGDLFGMVTFSDRVHGFLRAKSGRAHYNLCRDALYRLQPQTVTPDFDELCSFLGMRLRRRALLIFLTNLDDPIVAESFERNVELIRRKHLVLVAMLRQPRVQPLFSDPGAQSLDDLYQGLGGHLLWRNLRELGKSLERRGVRFSLIDSEVLCSRLVSQYVAVKQRQAL